MAEGTPWRSKQQNCKNNYSCSRVIDKKGPLSSFLACKACLPLKFVLLRSSLTILEFMPFIIFGGWSYCNLLRHFGLFVLWFVHIFPYISAMDISKKKYLWNTRTAILYLKLQSSTIKMSDTKMINRPSYPA